MSSLDNKVPPAMPVIDSGAPTGRRFEGRRCLVTGAGTGIGRATALRLAAEGGIVIAADIDSTRAEETAQQAGGGAKAMTLDVRSEDSVDALARTLTADAPGLDVLVNNAGIEIQGSVAETAPDAWDELMSVNLRGVYLMSRTFLDPLLQAARSTGRAAIVNNASLMGLVSSRRLAAYCASKAGVISLTRSMALDHAASGLRVNCVCPGIIHTEMLERRFAEFDDREEAYRRTRTRPPVQYLGRPQDVAAAIAYLASDEARFVTGSALNIDGGVGSE